MAIALIALLVFGSAASAQQNLPPSVTRDELEAITERPDDTSGRLDIEGGIERSPCPLAEARFADLRVTVGDVTFNNLKGVTPADMSAAWQVFRGTEQPVAVICEIRDAAASILRNKGYLAAVQVPTQRIENGAIVLEVLYGKIVSLRARGETKGAERKLEAYLAKLGDSEVFNRFEAERYLLLARDIPGYNVQLTLKPAATGEVGALIGEVSVLRRPYQVDLTLQNLAPRGTGPFGTQVRAQAFGLTGLGDATFVSFYSTLDFEEQQIFQLGHSFRPGGEGLQVAGTFTYAWTEPDFPTAAGIAGVEADTLLASLSARYPLVRGQARNIWVGGGFDFVDQDVDFLGPLTKDRLRVLWLRGRIDEIDLSQRIPRWRYGANIELRKGIDIFGASPGCANGACIGGIPPSRFDGDATAGLLRGDAEFEFALGTRFSMSVSPRVQIAFDPLFSFEEFTAGNYTVGRGYDPGSLTGDSGFGVSTELRGPRFELSEDGGLSLQPFAFFDSATVWQKNDTGSTELASAGGGLRASFSDRVFFDASVAVPLKRLPLTGERGDVRLLFTLSTRILPWESK